MDTRLRKTTSPIGVYDSGMGGLTVLQALIKRFPKEDFVYFADSVNLPYGDKSESEIIQYSHNIISWFGNNIKAKLVVSACHTSSGLALDKLKFPIPVIGTINPLSRCLLNNNISRNVGVFATPASVLGGIHERILKQKGFIGEIRSVACKELVPLIEAGDFDSEYLKVKIKNYFSEFKNYPLDTLIYGCTHYPFIRKTIESLLPRNIYYIDPAESITLEVFDFLFANNSLNDKNEKGNIQFYCSAAPHQLKEKIKIIIPDSKVRVKLKDPHAPRNNVFDTKKHNDHSHQFQFDSLIEP